MSTTTISATPVAVAQRYSPSMQALHWTIALLMFAVLPLAWAMMEMPRTVPNREFIYTLHKSIGMTIFVLAAIRLIVRASSPIPPEPAGTPRWMARSAIASHWLLYAILFIMPISGYVLSASAPAPLTYFDLFPLPQLPKNQAVAEAARSVHLLAQWAVYGLIALHVLATAWHVVVRRDGLLARELPYQRLN